MPLASKKDQRFAYSDYLTWPDEERWELIDGKAYDMTLAPSTRHQMVTLNLVRLIGTEVRGTSCRCFVAPTDVVFSEHDVVQPDVFVVCDRTKITEDEIIAHLVDGRTISVPLAWSWRLSEATPDQRERFEIIGDGQGVHWPDIDEDISVERMLCGSPARRPKGSSGSQSIEAAST
jgi:hypothetical protein